MSHVMNAALGAVALLLVFALTIGIGSGAALGDTADQIAAATETSLAQLAAILVIGACVIAATGLLPRWAGALSWTMVALSILLGPLFGPTVDLPKWAQDLSPFTHIPKVPAAALTVTVTPIVALTAIAAALALAGVSSFRRRNLALPT
jgi:putative exporter of polyketide antibiotics